MIPPERFVLIALLAALYTFTVVQSRGCNADDGYTTRYRQCVMAKLKDCGKP